VLLLCWVSPVVALSMRVAVALADIHMCRIDRAHGLNANVAAFFLILHVACDFVQDSL
jgi:hypothetical protein